ncbi:MAG: DUF1287 domain-containing protein [Syntrophomonadaceae bacterium]|nr:DUF1287 domain-containing protein [Syntrophomonadaceae bacterium]
MNNKKRMHKTSVTKLIISLVGAVIFLALFIYNPGFFRQLITGDNTQFSESSPVEKKAPEELTIQDLILLGARYEAQNGTSYDASYRTIEYPGGDVPADNGACTDVVIRAFRNAGIDLQQLIHEDMSSNFDIYPQKWGLSGPDSNIDHRRVPNQMQFFKRYGVELPLDVDEHLQDWQWGDVVYWRFVNGDEHCGIISDRKNSSDIPLVIHNAGKAKEEDALLRYQITGHYRYPAP